MMMFEVLVVKRKINIDCYKSSKNDLIKN